jgi:diguanylate cyclase (GGDEF)-like protein
MANHPDSTSDLDDAVAVAMLDEMRRARTIVPPTIRESFTTRYVIALLLIAALSGIAVYSGTRLVSTQADAAAEVNVSGRQRMLSQRIALEATLLAQSPPSDRAAVEVNLRKDIDLMASSQAALLAGDGSLGIVDAPTDAIQRRYDQGLAESVTDYLADALRLIESPDDTALLARLQNQATGDLLPDLDAAVQAYQNDSEQQVEAIGREEKVVLVATLFALLMEALFVFRPMSRRIARETARLEAAAARHRAEAGRHSFGLRLRDAVDLADTEEDLIDTIEQACTLSEVSGDFEFLRTDPDVPGGILARSIDPDAAAHHCSVSSADDCPAIRRSRTMVFESSEQLGACPRFRADARGAGDGEHAAVCTPVSFRGTGIGVLRSVTDSNHPRSSHEIEEMSMIALTAGTHIGTLRAFAASRSDAQHDPLTKLLNRRGLEHRVERLVAAGTRFVVGVVDLDHFKNVNDEYGHDAGDAALEETARVMASVLRPEDILARHGGEEFVVVLPMTGDHDIGEDRAAGVAVAERIRTALESATHTSSLQLCTASVGVAAARNGLAEALQRADEALYRAKELGRNRVEVDGDLAAGLDEILAGEMVPQDSTG